MPDTTTDYARGFRAGIEAAADRVRQGIAITQYAMDRNGPERWAYAVDALKDALDLIEDLKRPEPSEDAPHGYVFHNPDTGWEYAVSHPVLSGEVPDADNIRPATAFEADLCKQISRLKAAAPEPTEEMMERLSAWWRSWDTGLSSEAIALFLGMGVKSEHTPSDAADLGRCLRLLDKIPEWRPRLPEMRDAGGAWPFIVDRWPELEALYKAERWDAVYVTLTAAHRAHRAALAAMKGEG